MHACVTGCSTEGEGLHAARGREGRGRGSECAAALQHNQRSSHGRDQPLSHGTQQGL